MSVPCIAEYVFVCGKDTHHDIRSKCRTVFLSTDILQRGPRPEDFEKWNYDGSSTDQARGLDTEVHITPVAVWKHPFLSGSLPAFVVLTEGYWSNGEPAPGNTRHAARTIFDAPVLKALEPWYGFEQEWVLYKDGRPYGWPLDGSDPAPQGPYYCGTGPRAAFGRKFVTEHYQKCLEMGLHLSGTNGEVLPGQWEFQVGPCTGISAGDEVVMARWVLLRVLEAAEEPGLDACYELKPVKGDWNGSGMHCNFSTTETRAEGSGFAAIERYLSNLKGTVKKDIVFYGDRNNERMTGAHETSTLDRFTFGVGTRGTSIRIPNHVAVARSGYFEDRRPGADADPYLVSSRLFASVTASPAPALDALAPKYIRPWMTALLVAAV